MADYVIRMPDVGEGVAEAELVEWHVKPGDQVREDMVLAAVMTDKATVEIPSPVAGTVVWLAGEIGDVIAVKAPLVRLDVVASGETASSDDQPVRPESVQPEPVEPKPAASEPAAEERLLVAKPAESAKPASVQPSSSVAPRAVVAGEAKPLASPAVRRRAQDAGVDLRSLLPLDLDTIVQSVSKTGRCVVVHEATLTSGFGGEIAALVQEYCFYHLEAPVVRVAGWDTPYPHAQEWEYFPGPARVGRALLETMGA